MGLTVVVPVWSVSCGHDWTVIAAPSARQAEMTMVGRYVLAGKPAEKVRFAVRARRFTDKDLVRLRRFAELGDDDAAAMLRTLGEVSAVGEEPAPEEQLVLL